MVWDDYTSSSSIVYSFTPMIVEKGNFASGYDVAVTLTLKPLLSCMYTGSSQKVTVTGPTIFHDY